MSGPSPFQSVTQPQYARATFVVWTGHHDCGGRRGCWPAEPAPSCRARARAPIAADVVVGTPRPTKWWVNRLQNGGRVVLYENEVERQAPQASTVAVEEIEIGGTTLRILESCHSIWIFEP